MPAFIITEETSGDHGIADTLLNRAFGPGRFARAAYRLRENNQPVAGLSFIARRDGREGTPVGALQFWPVRIEQAPALLLGPLVVLPDYQGQGTGLALMRCGLEKAAAQGHKRVLLVGDPPYYTRAGFTLQEPGQLVLPGPVDPARVMILSLVPGTFDGVGGRVLPADAGR